MSEDDEVLTEAKRKTPTVLNWKSLQKNWNDLSEWRTFLSSTPDRAPVLKPSARPAGSSGLFFYRSPALDYSQIADSWFPDRNKTFKKKFVTYLSQLFSILIESELHPDETVVAEADGQEVHSFDLKKISRNYADHNEELVRRGFLHVLGLHENRENKKIKMRRYGVPREILLKGIERVYLSEAEKTGVIKSIRVSTEPDQTSPNLDPLCQYYADTLRRTTVDQQTFDQLEIPVGDFRRLYPMVVRHQQGKLDLKISPTEDRLHSVYLHAPKVFRKLLRLDGTKPMVEGDVAGSHFHFLLQEMTDTDEREQMKKDLISPDPYMSMCGNPSGVRREDLKQSSHFFKYASRANRSSGMTEEKAKRTEAPSWLIPYRERLFFRHVSEKYPTFADAMAGKEIFNHDQMSDFSCGVMKRESAVMVQAVGKRCMSEKLVYLPIHDGFLTLPEHYDRVCEIIVESFQGETGSTPRIKRKG
ncbi:MAG: hypothetical protein NTV51_10270 [Verrucomicrobia bacterium]|nr:hypothetical protein [Verrucomicrobiota bacterium]